ncbi:MAG TPA: DUF3237 domain-containing protein [Caulobacteraceae bacterium]
MTLQSRLFMTIELEAGEVIEVGDAGAGMRRHIALNGGHFEGQINGRVLPGGGDWQVVAADGSIEIGAHYPIETDQGQCIEVQSRGIRTAAPEIMARLAAGEAVDPALYYFRTTLWFRTGVPELERLNKIITVGVGERLPGLVRLKVYEIL